MTRSFIKNRKTLIEYKKLSKTQLIAVIITFISLVIFLFFSIIVGTISDKVIKKITKGVL